MKTVTTIVLLALAGRVLLAAVRAKAGWKVSGTPFEMIRYALGFCVVEGCRRWGDQVFEMTLWSECRNPDHAEHHHRVTTRGFRLCTQHRNAGWRPVVKDLGNGNWEFDLSDPAEKREP